MNSMLRCTIPLLLTLSVLGVHAAKRHPNAISSMEELWSFIFWVYALLVAPVLLWSLWTLVRDPTARELPPLAGQWAKRKLYSFLSAPSNERGIAVGDSKEEKQKRTAKSKQV